MLQHIHVVPNFELCSDLSRNSLEEQYTQPPSDDVKIRGMIYLSGVKQLLCLRHTINFGVGTCFSVLC